MTIRFKNGIEAVLVDTKQLDNGLFELHVVFTFVGQEAKILVDMDGHNAEGNVGYSLTEETMQCIF